MQHLLLIEIKFTETSIVKYIKQTFENKMSKKRLIINIQKEVKSEFDFSNISTLRNQAASIYF